MRWASILRNASRSYAAISFLMPEGRFIKTSFEESHSKGCNPDTGIRSPTSQFPAPAGRVVSIEGHLIVPAFYLEASPGIGTGFKTGVTNDAYRLPVHHGACNRLAPGPEAAPEQTAAGEASQACPVDPLPPSALGRIGAARLRHGDEVTRIALSPDGATLASDGGLLDRRKIRLWDRVSSKVIPWPRPADSILSVDSLAFSRVGRTLAPLAEMTVFLWDVPSSSRLLKFDVPDACNILCFTPDGQARATAGHSSRTIRLWDKDTGKIIRAFTGTPMVGHSHRAIRTAWFTFGMSIRAGSLNT
jgi:hypothetical protein